MTTYLHERGQRIWSKEIVKIASRALSLIKRTVETAGKAMGYSRLSPQDLEVHACGSRWWSSLPLCYHGESVSNAER